MRLGPAFFLVLLVLACIFSGSLRAAHAEIGVDPDLALACPEAGVEPSPFPDDLPAPPPWETARAGALAAMFEVSSVGQAHVTIPLQAVPGRAGMEPRLSLTYDSAAGDGLLGKGFSLSGLSAITRCPRSVAQDGFLRGVRYDNADALCLDGKRLVLVAWGADASEYRTFPDSFRKIIAYRGSLNQGWDPEWGPQRIEVYAKTGMIYEYGVTPDSKALAGDGTVRAFWLSRARDRSGNTIDYHYYNPKDPSLGHTLFVAPRRIDYTGHPSAPASRAIAFDYSSMGARDAYVAGMRITSPLLLSAIRMLGPGDARVRDYRFDYIKNPNTDHFLLDEIQECGADNINNCKPPTYFGWYEGSAPGFEEISSQVPIPFSDQASLMPMDSTGDGLDDLVLVDLDSTLGQKPTGDFRSLFRVAQNSGTKPFFSLARVAYEHDHLVDPNHPPTQLRPELGTPIDYDHDGRMDILLHDIYGQFANWQVLRSKQNFGFERMDTGIAHHFPALASPPFLIAHPEASAHLADLDGDGMSDLVECRDSGISFEWTARFWRPDDPGFSQTPMPIPGIDDYPCNQSVLTTDIDGDGKIDLLLKEWFSNGNGQGSAGTVYHALSYVGPGGWSFSDTKLPISQGRVVFLDINADGLPDAIEGGFADHALRTYLNTGEGFVGPYDELAWPNGEADKFFGVAVPIDQNGDGRQDLLIPLQEGNEVPIWHVLRSKGEPESGALFYKIPAGIPFDAQHLIAGVELAHPHGPRVSDVDGDGAQDVILPVGGLLKVFRSTRGEQDVLHTITDGLNRHHAPGVIEPGYVPNVTIAYGRLIDKQLYAAGSCVYPLRCVTGPKRVVRGYTLNNGADGERHFALAYRDGRYDRLGRGFLGFGERIVRDLDTGGGTIEVYDNTSFDADLLDYPYAGQAERVLRYSLGTGKQIELSYTRTYRQTIKSQGGLSYFTLPVIREEKRKQGALPFGTSAEQYARDAESSGTLAATLSRTQRVIADYDEYGNIREESALADGVDLYHHVQRQFTNDESNWLIGQLTSESVCSSALSTTQCRVTTRSYDSLGQLESVQIGSGDGDPTTQLGVSFVRDDVGNIVETIAADAQGQTRASCTSYDLEGIFPYAHRNPAGHLSYFKMDPGFGVPKALIDANGLITQWAYDGFGRMVEELRPDGTTRIMSLERSQEQGAWHLRRTVADAGGDERTVEFDGRGRAIRWWWQKAQSPGASTSERVMEEIVFDALGEHVARRSLPAAENLPASQRAYHEYKRAQRAMSATIPMMPSVGLRRARWRSMASSSRHSSTTTRWGGSRRLAIPMLGSSWSGAMMPLAIWSGCAMQRRKSRSGSSRLRMGRGGSRRSALATM